MQTKLRVRFSVLFALLAIPALAACSTGPNKIKVDLTSYKLGVSANSAKAGTVVFTVKNQTSDATHEMLIIKTDLAPDKLPMLSPDKVDETAIAIVGKMEDIPPGQGGDLSVNLTPGNYVFICDVDGHYAHGMFSAFTVTP